MLEVNLRAPIALARCLAPDMIARGHGHMVFVSSLSGKAASPASSIYSATKFGLRGFALALRADLAPHGVGVSTVLPGFIRDAGMFAEADVTLPRGVGTRSPEQVAEAVMRAIEKNRAEVDVAPLALRLGSSFASRRARDRGRSQPAHGQRADRHRPGARSGQQAPLSAPRRAYCRVTACSPVTVASTSMISSASLAPSAARSGVAWTRTTTSSPSTSWSRTCAADRVGVEMRLSSNACTWLGRTPEDRRTLTSTAVGLAERYHRGAEHDVVGDHDAVVAAGQRRVEQAERADHALGGATDAHRSGSARARRPGRGGRSGARGRRRGCPGSAGPPDRGRPP